MEPGSVEIISMINNVMKDEENIWPQLLQGHQSLSKPSHHKYNSGHIKASANELWNNSSQCSGKV